MWLSESQVEQLTKKKRPSAQMRVLAEAGINFLVVAGRPIVSDSAVTGDQGKRVKLLGGMRHE